MTDGLFQNLGRRKYGFVEPAENLVRSRYLIGMALWVIVKLVSRMEYLVFTKETTDLDNQCMDRLHEAMRLISKGLREIDAVATLAGIPKEGQNDEPVPKT